MSTAACTVSLRRARCSLTMATRAARGALEPRNVSLTLFSGAPSQNMLCVHDVSHGHTRCPCRMTVAACAPACRAVLSYHVRAMPAQDPLYMYKGRRATRSLQLSSLQTWHEPRSWAHLFVRLGTVEASLARAAHALGGISGYGMHVYLYMYLCMHG